MFVQPGYVLYTTLYTHTVYIYCSILHKMPFISKLCLFFPQIIFTFDVKVR
jgi:hypothetical protein